MKITLKLLLFGFTVFFALSLYSCLNVERTVIINKDGSGSEVIYLQIKRQFFKMMTGIMQGFDSTKGENFSDSIYNFDSFGKEVKDEFEGTGGRTLRNYTSVTNPDSSRTYRMEFDFRDLKGFGETKKKGTGGDITAKMEEKNGKVFFTMTFSTKDKNDSSGNDTQNLAALMKGGKLVYNFSFPYKVESSNSTSVLDNIYTWEYDLEKITMEQKEYKLEAIMTKY